MAEKVNKTLRFVAKVQEDLKKDNEKSKDRSLQLADIFACDAFAGFDDIIIEWALRQLDDEILDSQIDGLSISQIADQRSSMAYHYCDKYKYEYRAIKFAYMMMKSVALMEFTSDIKVLVENYKNETYLIDSYYRWFYHAYDKIEDNSRFSNVRERVENIYANTYLQAITPKWNENFTIDSMEQTGLLKQEDFYKHYLKSYDGKQRVIVIISDAFRYECARELFGRLELDEKCTPKMECMLSCLPSVTSVGMASLLPHKEMNVTADMTVTVDGQACASMEQRDKILKYFKLGNNLNQRDAIAVRKLISGFIKLIYPDGEVSKEEVAEIMDISLELRRRVKEQLKKIGGMEFYDVNFSYIDNDSFDEHFVSVPEQGGGKMIPEGMGKPGCLYTVSKSKTGMIGCYRLETQMMPGNGKLTCTGIGSGKEPKEATNTAFNYLKANGNAISGSISTTTKDYIINYQDMQGLGMTGNLALPTLIAISSAALSKPPISSLAVLGEISIGGTLIKVEDLASTLQVCLDSGAKKVLLPITSAADLGTVPSDLVGAFSLIFYSSPEEAVYKALGVE